MNDNERVYPWDGLTLDERNAALDAKTLATPGDCFGKGQFYVVLFGDRPSFVPVDCFDGFAATLQAETLDA
jgi:hypothetical protein